MPALCHLSTELFTGEATQMRVRLSVVFEGHCFSPLKSSFAVSGIICRQVFRYLKDFEEKMRKNFRYFEPITYNALPAVLLLLAVAF